MAAPKVIVLGSLNGKFQTAFTKLATLHSKNNFSFAIVAGDLFGPEDDDSVTSILNGDIKIPLSTYFTVGTNPLPARVIAKIEADEEICENLHFLGKRSTMKTSEGIRIITLGGRLDADIVGGQSKEQHLPFHTADDAKALRGANSADILLTTIWPANVWNGSKIVLSPENQAAVTSTAEVAELCAALKPRYHISSSPTEFFYEREPFFQAAAETNDESPITRFISIAPYGNAAKAKAMYAFSLTPGESRGVPPIGTTRSPFAERGRKRVHEEGTYSRFSNGHHNGHHSKRNKHRRNASPPPGPDKCFFCLSSSTLAVHMICAVGNESYLATAKGPLATATTFAKQGLECPSHLIIAPIPHTPTVAYAGAPDYAASDAEKAHVEMTRFRESLQAMVSAKSKHQLGTITWEISRARNIHVHWQLHAVPSDLIYKGLVEAAFRVEAENLKYPKFENRELSLEKQGELGDFFRIWIWADNGEDKIKGSSLVMPLDPEMRFDLQYPRKVIAKLLGLEDRFFWQDCVQTEPEESQDADAVKASFKEWDFTLRD